MRGSTLATLAASVSSAAATYKGFNYGSTYSDGSDIIESGFEALFNTAKALVGTSGFTSARLYTMIQGGTTDTVISAIPAALTTETSLLLGVWASQDQAGFSNEITALTNAISQYGSQGLADYVVGISVGSEDLYRDSSTGQKADAGYGVGPSVIVDYIGQIRTAIAGTVLSSVPVGHVDTWTAWVNGTNDNVIAAVDFAGMDAYPYFQNTEANSIADGPSLFTSAYDATIAAVGDVPVWVTETGWPVSGSTENEGVPSLANAQTYWDEVGCEQLFGKVNTWWYTLQDAYPTTPSPSFGIVGTTLSDTPLYNLTCPAGTSGSSSSVSSSSAASKSTSVAAATTPTSVPVSATSTVSENPVPSASLDASTTGTTAASSVASSSVVKSSAASSATGATTVVPSSSVTAITTASTETVSGDVTLTVYKTTLITITSCSESTICTSSSTLSTAPASSAASVTTKASSAASVTTKASSAASVTTKASSAVSSASKTASGTSATASATACSANLSGDYQYPHLIVPVSSTSPNTAYGTQYNGTINSTVSTIFNFDIPASYAGLSCSLIFLFPEQSALETSAYTFNGEGGIVSHVLSSAANSSTTYANQGAQVLENGAISSLVSGNSYVISSDKCPASTTVAFELSSTGGLALEFFEDYNPSPLGLYVRAC